VPDVATIVIDMLNPYDHEDGEALADQVAERIDPLRTLIDATLDAGATLVYANDNYDDFTATRQDLIDNALEGKHPELIKPIVPPDEALFVQKVRHSAFYESALNHLLHVNEVKKLVLAGQVTEQCVLYSALDAYIRGFEIVVARDAVAPLDEELGEAALKMMAGNMSAELVDAADAY
jgi:nicotinamidase-related amidase